MGHSQQTSSTRSCGTHLTVPLPESPPSTELFSKESPTIPPSPKRRRVEIEEVEDEEATSTLRQEAFVSVDFGGAGAVVEGGEKMETDFQKLKREKEERGEEMWLPFKSREEWELSRWLMLSGVTQSSIEEFLQLPVIKNKISPSFKNKRTFFNTMDKLPKVRGGWRCEELEIVGDIVERGGDGAEKARTEVLELWMRDPVECIRELLQDPRFKDDMHYAPEKVYTNLSMKTRAVSEMWTADWWWATQKLLPKGATIAPVILASDKTQLSTFSGDKSAWPVYMTIGNISASIRRKPSEQATVLVGYIPVSKLECFSPNVRSLEGYRLFHDCMRKILDPLVTAGDPAGGGKRMLCSGGRVREVYPILAAYVADFPEQCLVAGCQERRCPKCLARGDQLGELLNSVLRDPSATIDALKDARKGKRERADEWGLRHITPFWKDLPLCNIFHCFTPDILHQLHKGVFKDHLVKWSIESLPHSSHAASKSEVDVRFQSMPRHSDLRHFKKGISLITQWTGNEYKNMEKVFLGVLSGTASRDVIICVRAALDFIYYAQLDIHTQHSLKKMDEALRTFHNHKDTAFVEPGVREHFNIPKLHSMKHYVPMLKSHGVAGGYNTEWSERLHIDFAKNAYRASNRKDFIKQMTKWLDRQESVRNFTRFLSWSLDENRMSGSGESEDDSDESECEVECDGGGGNGEEATARPEGISTGSDSDNRYSPDSPIYSFANRPPLSLELSTLETDYGCDRLVHCLEKFLVERGMRREDYWDTEPGRYKVYKQFRLSLPPIPEASSVPFHDTIHATPSFTRNGKHITSRFDTVLAREKAGDTPTVGLRGLRVGQIRAIFQLPESLGTYPHPLVYIHWFTPLRKIDEDTQMFRIERSSKNKVRSSSIIPITQVARSCHLIPYSGKQHERTWTSESVLDQCHSFHLNSYLRLSDFVLLRLRDHDL
ncbi:hypothetical protein PM082_019521 [Marasmius tenuissimus]|nr:hypothetical protein PM082_019521 [Marasmius tenuissimus]